jgi:hypothetical protein
MVKSQSSITVFKNLRISAICFTIVASGTHGAAQTLFHNQEQTMSKVYDGHLHTHVYVNHPKSGRTNDTQWPDEAWHGTFNITLHTGTYVWVMAGYTHEGHPEIKIVKDGRGEFYDECGNCILSVPAAWCEYYTAEEANAIEEGIAADYRLMGYAR